MGVGLWVLYRLTVPLSVGGTVHSIGTLRYVSKITELDDRRAAVLEEARTLPSPVAVLVAETTELLGVSGGLVPAHRVLGWDGGRTHVSDLAWDFLPTLGYGVRIGEGYLLHALVDDVLRPVRKADARTSGLLDAEGRLVRRGQPVIVSCASVTELIPGFAAAEVVLADGRNERLILRLEGDALPDPAWLVSRTPRGAEVYPG